MMQANTLSESCVAIADNFLFAALEIAALKHMRFKRGELPDLPPTCPGFYADHAVEMGSSSESRYYYDFLFIFDGPSCTYPFFF